MINFESVRHSHTKAKYQTRETIPIYHHMGYEQALSLCEPDATSVMPWMQKELMQYDCGHEGR
jgi:hypothetical protein